MTIVQPARAQSTLADALPIRGTSANVALVVGGAALMALAAQVSIPLWPVPITGQTFTVLLLGAALGPWRGSLSLLLNIAAGLVGIPVFASGTHGVGILLGPTGGYLISFPIAAFLVGALARRGWDRSATGTIVSFAIGDFAIYVIALPWLAISLASAGAPHSATDVFALGLVPFVIGDAIKIAIAAASLPLAWRVCNRFDPSPHRM